MSVALAIEGYEPQWHHTARTLAAVHRARFTRLIGRPLAGAWVLWDSDRQSRFGEGPVILGFGDTNVEITHRKFDECGITWDQVDMSAPLDWPGLRLDWRAAAHPALAAVTGRLLREVNVIERILPSQWRPRLLDAIELRFEGARLAVYNAMDENGLSSRPEVTWPIGFWRRVPIA
ncbi:hypothetical protein Ais01nite_32660 [Asanoa ishikariensis]|uniref:Uncharacterized protein n=1 Tax=Asanoa ishikariensis TaxID=137265 RepID=A0A1H3UW90_9ACTN|nr:hypothetical protein [Asanoa ishikariensis]GIF65231.1 hypothetical protein Ais01nite_32660 [Asanoa ishikariensis]SDZ66702.1 hypothetical protein SAMN05421684_8269 [Asanoa ishikariensis]